MITDVLQRELDAIPAVKAKPNLHLGQCANCSDYGSLKKTPWTDPYTDETGIGWLCEICFNRESVKRVRAKMSWPEQKDHFLGKRVDLSKEYNPVPKPLPRKKKK